MQYALVCDDDSIIPTIVRSVLTRAGYTVVLAASGREALSLAPTLDARLAIIDLGMPGGNGLQACAALRQIPSWRDVPIIILTSYSVRQALSATLRAGADGFVCKPLVPAELLETVALHVARKAAKRGFTVNKEFDPRFALDPVDAPQEEPLLPGVGSGWILR